MKNGLIIDNNNKFWYEKGVFHREDGPAVIWNDGGKSWWIRDRLHREDGPAIEDINGTKKWYINGRELTESQFKLW